MPAGPLIGRVAVLTVYGPDDPGCSSEPVFTSTVTVTGNGDYPSGAFIPDEAGVYRWRVEYSGDNDNDPAATTCGDPNQTVTVAAQAPGLALTKTATGIVDGDGNGIDAGDTIGFSFTVTNTGNVALHGVTVSDPMVGGPVSCDGGPLEPGASRSCGPALYVLSDGDLGSTLTNTATATAVAPSGDSVESSATATATIPHACAAPPTSEAPATSEDPSQRTRRRAARNRRPCRHRTQAR